MGNSFKKGEREAENFNYSQLLTKIKDLELDNRTYKNVLDKTILENLENITKVKQLEADRDERIQLQIEKNKYIARLKSDYNALADYQQQQALAAQKQFLEQSEEITLLKTELAELKKLLKEAYKHVSYNASNNLNDRMKEALMIP